MRFFKPCISWANAEFVLLVAAAANDAVVGLDAVFVVVGNREPTMELLPPTLLPPLALARRMPPLPPLPLTKDGVVVADNDVVESSNFLRLLKGELTSGEKEVE